MPVRGYPALGFGEPIITIHPPIQTTGRDVESLMQESHAAIVSALRECDLVAPPPGSNRGTPEPQQGASSGSAATKKSD
jgi:hypothetical protein